MYRLHHVFLITHTDLLSAGLSKGRDALPSLLPLILTQCLPDQLTHRPVLLPGKLLRLLKHWRRKRYGKDLRIPHGVYLYDLIIPNHIHSNPKSCISSSARGSNATAVHEIFPSNPPGILSRAASPTGTNFNTGSWPRAIMTSSPSQAFRMISDRFVLASRIV